MVLEGTDVVEGGCYLVPFQLQLLDLSLEPALGCRRPTGRPVKVSNVRCVPYACRIKQPAQHSRHVRRRQSQLPDRRTSRAFHHVVHAVLTLRHHGQRDTQELAANGVRFYPTLVHEHEHCCNDAHGRNRRSDECDPCRHQPSSTCPLSSTG